MSKKRVAINGFGRIGRLTFRNLINDDSIEVVAINDLTDNATLAHLLKFDSVHGKFDGTVTATDTHLVVNGKEIQASSERNPEALNWAELNVDTVLECTGIFRDRKGATMHITAGAKKVILSAPAKGSDIKTIVLGVNDGELTGEEDILSNASCTTNCLAPVCKILTDNFNVVKGSMTTIHGYTSDQNLQDAPHSDLRRARAAAINIVPTTTGAATATALVVPAIGNKLTSMAFRVPIPTGSMIELNVLIEENTDVDSLKAMFKKHADTDMKGILEYSTDELVSSDIVGNKHSSILDSNLIDVLDGNFLKVVSWYDNEAGYSARLAELVAKA